MPEMYKALVDFQDGDNEYSAGDELSADDVSAERLAAFEKGGYIEHVTNEEHEESIDRGSPLPPRQPMGRTEQEPVSPEPTAPTPPPSTPAVPSPAPKPTTESTTTSTPPPPSTGTSTPPRPPSSS